MGNTPTEKERNYSDYFVSGDCIGSGTFATVKRCTRLSDKKEFAVKIIDKKHLTGREMVGLKDEIRILKLMEHPYVIKMYDVFDDTRKVKMILELCEGGDLFDQILKSPNRRFDEKKAARITVIIARAIHYLHLNHVVHRDLKPENILFTKSGTLKVTDFGLAHYLKMAPQYHIMHTCCGTPHYVAPEVLGSNEYSIQVDYWSLGVILYIMLSGYQPFNSHSIHAMYGMIIRGQYRFPSPHWDHVSEIAKDCVRQLMCVDPTKRLNCEKLLQHEFITKNVDIDEILQQEQQLLAHQKELIKESDQQLTKSMPPKPVQRPPSKLPGTPPPSKSDLTSQSQAQVQLQPQPQSQLQSHLQPSRSKSQSSQSQQLPSHGNNNINTNTNTNTNTINTTNNNNINTNTTNNNNTNTNTNIIDHELKTEEAKSGIEVKQSEIKNEQQIENEKKQQEKDIGNSKKIEPKTIDDEKTATFQ